MRRPGLIHSRGPVPHAALAAILLLVACESTPPRGPGAIQIQSTVNNEEFSFFDYGIAIDGGAPYEAFSSVTKNILAKGLAHGPHTVTLENLPSQCSAGAAGPERTVTVQGDDTVGVVFNIACARITGDLTIAVTTTGSDLDPDGYLVLMDGFIAAFVATNSSTSLSFLTPDLYTVALTDVASNCTYGGAQNVSVGAGSKATVNFAVTCAPLAHLRLVVSSSGVDADVDGLLLSTGGNTQRVALNSSLVVPVPIGAVSYTVSDIQPNCTMAESTTGSATLASDDTLVVNATLTCTALPEGVAGTSAADPALDTLPHPASPAIPALDIIGLSSRHAAGFLILSLKFSSPIVSAYDEAPNSLFGYVELDADENATTGFQPIANLYGASANIGVDFAVILHEGSPTSAFLFGVVTEDPDLGEFPVRFGGDSVVLYIPLEKLLDDDGNVAAVMLNGPFYGPSDYAPNAGAFVAHAPASPFVAGAGTRPLPRAVGPGKHSLLSRLPSQWKRPR